MRFTTRKGFWIVLSLMGTQTTIPTKADDAVAPRVDFGYAFAWRADAVPGSSISSPRRSQSPPPVARRPATSIRQLRLRASVSNEGDNHSSGSRRGRNCLFRPLPSVDDVSEKRRPVPDDDSQSH